MLKTRMLKYLLEESSYYKQDTDTFPILGIVGLDKIYLFFHKIQWLEFCFKVNKWISDKKYNVLKN
jgi:hypothetical protein